MKKGLILFYSAFLIPFFSFSQSKPDTVTFLDNKVKILVPKELSKMSDEAWSVKYPNKKRPTFALSDESGEINLLADMTQQPAAESQLASYKDFRIAQLKKNWPDLKIVEEGVKTVQGKKVEYFKFLTQAIDQKIFNYYFFIIIDGKILFFTFNCVGKLQRDWEKRADDMVATLKTK